MPSSTDSKTVKLNTLPAQQQRLPTWADDKVGYTHDLFSHKFGLAEFLAMFYKFIVFLDKETREQFLATLEKGNGDYSIIVARVFAAWLLGTSFDTTKIDVISWMSTKRCKDAVKAKFGTLSYDDVIKHVKK
jgi:hypothetical protein